MESSPSSNATDNVFSKNNTDLGSPSEIPTKLPTLRPSFVPTPSARTDSPTVLPTKSVIPSSRPSYTPSDLPTVPPSLPPSSSPTKSLAPSTTPSFGPTQKPSSIPSSPPTQIPTSSVIPSSLPSWSPSNSPSTSPSALPSIIPTDSAAPSTSSAPSIAFQWEPGLNPLTAQDHWSFSEASDPMPITIYCLAIGVMVFGISILCLRQYIKYKRWKQRKEVKLKAIQKGIPIPPKPQETPEQRELMQGLTILIELCELISFILFFGLEYCLRWGRYSVLKRLSDVYDPVINDDSGDLAYIYRPYYDHMQPTNEELQAEGCTSLVSVSRNFTSVGDDLCQIGFVRPNPRLVYTGLAKFSIVIGFIIFLILESGVLYGERAIREKLKEKKKSMHWCWYYLQVFLSHTSAYVIFLVVNSHQSMTLMPTGIITPRPYCLDISVPPGYPSTKLLACQHIRTTAGIPIGVPLLCGCALFAAMIAAKSEASNNDERTGEAIVKIGSVIGFFAFLVPGVGLFGAWLFLGLIFGPWVHFTGFLNQPIFAISESMAPMMMFVVDMLM